MLVGDESIKKKFMDYILHLFIIHRVVVSIMF